MAFLSRTLALVYQYRLHWYRFTSDCAFKLVQILVLHSNLIILVWSGLLSGRGRGRYSQVVRVSGQTLRKSVSIHFLSRAGDGAANTGCHVSSGGDCYLILSWEMATLLSPLHKFGSHPAESPRSHRLTNPDLGRTRPRTTGSRRGRLRR